MNSQNIQVESSNIVNSLSDILNSLNSETNANTETETETKANSETNANLETNANTETISNMDKNSNENLNNSNSDNSITYQNKITNTIELFSDNTDRRIGNYLLDQIEKKQIYIDELEEVIKFQQKEISDLKSKLDSINKLELVARLKSSIEEKRNLSNNIEISYNEQNDIDESDQKTQQTQQTQQINFNKEQKNEHKNEPEPKVVQVVKVKKIQTEQTFVPSNPDLVLNTGSKNKVKSIPKAEEEKRYNGITLVEIPQSNQATNSNKQIFIEYDQGSEMSESTDKTSEIVRQRRRGARL